MPDRQSIYRRTHRAGITLAELLIVVAIILIFAAVAIPMLKVGLEDRKVREASRMLNGFFAGAQARAAESGLPSGVWIERASVANSNITGRISTQVFAANTPPPYGGDFATARTIVNAGTRTASFDAQSAGLSILVQNGDVRSGDLIRFNHVGPYYTITAVSPAPLQIQFTHSTAPSPAGGGRIPYQIVRSPRKSKIDSLDLPDTAVIDLNWSGLGAGGVQFRQTSEADTTPVIIMFGASGRVDRVYLQGVPLPPTGRPNSSIHLLIGRDDQLQGDATVVDVQRDNLYDGSALWVSAGHKTGSITTADNAIPDTASPLQDARQFARRAHVKGGG